MDNSACRKRGGLPPGTQAVARRGRDSLLRLIDTGEQPAHELVELNLDRVCFIRQPRQMLPAELVDSLLAEGRLTPRRLVAELQRLGDAGDVAAQATLAGLRELAASIAVTGIEQPVSVYRDLDGEGYYIVKTGHRRCVAALLAGRETVLAVVREQPGSPLELLRDQLAENLQREDMPPGERAAALAELRFQIRSQLMSDTETGFREQHARTEHRTILTETGFRRLVQELGITPTALADLYREVDFVDGVAELTSRDLDRLSLAVLAALTGFQPRRLRQMMEVENVALPPPEQTGLTESHLRQVARLEPDQQPRFATAIRELRLSRQDAKAVADRVRRDGYSLSAAIAEAAEKAAGKAERAKRRAATTDARLAQGIRQIQSGLRVLQAALDMPAAPTPAALDAARAILGPVIQDLRVLDRTMQAKAIWGRQVAVREVPLNGGISPNSRRH